MFDAASVFCKGKYPFRNDSMPFLMLPLPALTVGERLLTLSCKKKKKVARDGCLIFGLTRNLLRRAQCCLKNQCGSLSVGFI